jgi:hypothetical protein
MYTLTLDIDPVLKEKRKRKFVKEKKKEKHLPLKRTTSPRLHHSPSCSRRGTHYKERRRRKKPLTYHILSSNTTLL